MKMEGTDRRVTKNERATAGRSGNQLFNGFCVYFMKVSLVQSPLAAHHGKDVSPFVFRESGVKTQEN
jgi:hypothetical protein